MVRVKSPSPSPSGGGEEELESFDLHTPDTLRLVGSNETPLSGRKRSITVYSGSPSAKRANAASSASKASAVSRKKKTTQLKSPKKPRVKAPKFIFGFDFGTT